MRWIIAFVVATCMPLAVWGGDQSKYRTEAKDASSESMVRLGHARAPWQILVQETCSGNGCNIDVGNVDLGFSFESREYVIGTSNFITIQFGSVTTGGSSDFQIVQDSCSGFNTPASHCSVSFEFIPSSLGTKNAGFVFPWVGTRMVGSEVVNVNGAVSFNFTGTSQYKPVESNLCESGSIINIDNQSVGERIPIVGTDFDLVYLSEFAPEFISSTTNFQSQFSFNLERWTISAMNLYDPMQRRLFMGVGRSYSKTYTKLSDNNLLVVSPNGEEVFIFDPSGKHLFTKTALTGVLKYTFGYDTNSYLVSIEDAFGNITVITRDTNGYMTDITSPYGQNTDISLDLSGYVTSVTNPNSETYTITYKSATSLMETFEKSGGQVSTFTYDANGKLIKDLGNGGNFLDFVTGTNSLLVSTQMNRETSHALSYDSSGAYERTTSFPSGLQTWFFEQVDGSSIRSDANEEMVSQVRTPDERFGKLLYRPSVNEYQVSSVKSVTTLGQTISGGSEFFDYSTLTRTSATSGRVTTAVFNNTAKTWTLTSQEGATQVDTVNGFEQIIQRVVGNDIARTYTYDTLGRRKSTQQGIKNQLTYAYDTLGNLQSITNSRSEVTSFGYDPAGRLTQMTLPDTRLIQYQYDASGNLTGITPPGRPQHGFSVNAFELVSQYQPPTLTGVPQVNTVYSYNMDKQLTQVTRPDGQSVVYNYDATTALLNSITVPGGSYTYAYQPLNPGRIASIQSPNGAKNDFTYRGYMRASDEQVRVSDSASLGKVSYGYDVDHRVTSRSVQGNPSTSPHTINITLNGDNEPTQVGNLALTYTYPSGRLAGTEIGVVSDSHTYDAYGNLETYTATLTPVSGPPETLYTYTLTRDSMSRITGMSETILGVTNAYVYTFDSAGRLTNVQKNSTNLFSATYDSNSNRTSGVSDGYSFMAAFDNQDRMTSYNSRTYSYNANGDLQQVQDSLGATTTFNYDVFGNLLQTTLANGKSFSYHTDGLNRRVAKFSGVNGMARYLYDPRSRIAAELDETGIVVKEFVYANTRSHVPAHMIDANGEYRIITDHLGSPRLVVNVSDGAVLQRMDYNVFGKVIVDTNSCFQPFGFAGGLYDADTKLVRFGARDYDPEVGRWTTKDPIRFNGGDTNLYGYVMNDPVNLIDSNGLSARDVGTIRGRFNDIVGNMTRLGLRHPDPYWNNFTRGLSDLTGGRLGNSQRLGCYEQANEARRGLDRGDYDDKWQFVPEEVYGGLHHRVKGISNNPSDPVLTIDPWHGTISP